VADEYTPTKSEVEGNWCYVPPHAYGKSEREHRQTERRQQFHRWLAAHDAEIRRDQAERDIAEQENTR